VKKTPEYARSKVLLWRRWHAQACAEEERGSKSEVGGEKSEIAHAEDVAGACKSVKQHRESAGTIINLHSQIISEGISD
jgi:hypothetical protein